MGMLRVLGHWVVEKVKHPLILYVSARYDAQDRYGGFMSYSENGHMDALYQALQAMQSGNSIDSPYAHSYMDGLLGLIEGCRSGKSDPDETLEQIMIDMVSFQQFLDMRLTVLEKKQDPPITW